MVEFNIIKKQQTVKNSDFKSIKQQAKVNKVQKQVSIYDQEPEDVYDKDVEKHLTNVFNLETLD